MSANERQVGGQHYKSTFQHWDLVEYLKLPYLTGQVLRYVARWRKKAGLQDLEKALHYLNKMREVEMARCIKYHTLLQEFIEINKLQPREETIFKSLVNFHIGSEELLNEARRNLMDMILISKKNPPVVIPEDPTFLENRDEWKTA